MSAAPKVQRALVQGNVVVVGGATLVVVVVVGGDITAVVEVVVDVVVVDAEQGAASPPTGTQQRPRVLMSCMPLAAVAVTPISSSPACSIPVVSSRDCRTTKSANEPHSVVEVGRAGIGRNSGD